MFTRPRSQTAEEPAAGRPAVLFLVLLASALLLLAGCTTKVEPIDPVDRDVPSANADRDVSAVRAGVAALDPCALLDPAVRKDLGMSADEEPWREPFTCVLRDRVRVQTYVEHGPGTRFWEEKIDLSGATAYRNSDLFGWCKIAIPVDHHHAIEISQDADDGYDCTAPEAFAKQAIDALLNDPASLARKDEDGIIACEVLEPLVGIPPKGTVVEPREGQGVALGRCGVWKEDGTGFTAVDPERGLVLRYSSPLESLRADGQWDDYPLITIDGTEVMVLSSDPEDKKDDDGQCRLMWDSRPASALDDDDVLRAEVEAPTCEDARKLAEKAVPAMKSAKPAAPREPARVFASDEPDGAAVGACADAVDQANRKCAPASDSVPVPDSPAEVIVQGEADPNVLCAAALSTVQDTMSSELVPVTIARPTTSGTEGEPVCEFVEPRHSLVVRVSASTETLDSFATVDSPGLVDLAGHTASISTADTTGWETSRSARVALAEVDEPGVLEVEILAHPDRSQGVWSGSKVDTKPVDRITDLAEALARELLEK